MGGSLEAIRYSHADGGAALHLLEQRALPQKTEWVEIDGPKASWHAIKEMTVRGAPAIGAAAASRRCQQTAVHCACSRASAWQGQQS